MKHIYLTFTCLLLQCCCYAQGEENIWMFGRASALDFTAATPVAGIIPNSGGAPPAWEYMHSGAVCDRSGSLLFWIKLQNNTNPGAENIINAFTSAGQPMPNGNMLSHIKGDGVPVIIPHPADKKLYYVFYIKNAGLHYSMVDLRLNGGQGDIVTTQKNILIGSYGSLVEQKMTAVKGCTSTWLVVRSRNKNEYYSYEITDTGLNTKPAVSQCGTLPTSWYGGLNHYSGVIKASADGKKMAAACVVGIRGSNFYDRGGLELYDVRSCDGTIYNPTLLDTGAYFGVCFSPDGSKLYATKIFDRSVYQFDLSLSTTASIIASKALILTNPSFGTIFPQRYMLGDLKRAPDGKIYTGNNACDAIAGGNAVHVIRFPNLAGMACSPALNIVALGNASVCTGLFLPADIVVPSYAPNLATERQTVYSCFNDSITIAAPEGNTCYRWNNGANNASVTVTANGRYFVSYTDQNCTRHVDSFDVYFPQLPLPSLTQYACPSAYRTILNLRATDSSSYRYTWIKPNGDTARMVYSQNGDSLIHADTGTYTIYIQHPAGCDTQFKMRVVPLPKPEAHFIIPNTACAGEPIKIQRTSSAPAWKWYLADTDSTTSMLPDWTFLFAGEYTITLVERNAEGCIDSFSQQVNVQGFELQLSADQYLAERGTSIQLYTTANLPYSISSWWPQHLFSNQYDRLQRFMLDTTRKVTVYGTSIDGCSDSASILLEMLPITNMPNAFSPNGDGLNDLFRPVVYGDVFIRLFEIYNRWGTCIYKDQGKRVRGWDGTYQGKPAELGTYYYVIEMEGIGSKTIWHKGDVILIR